MRINKISVLLMAAAAWSPAQVTVYYQPLGIELQFAAKVEPGGSLGSAIGGGVQVGAGHAHRLICDNAQKRYFGYDLDVQSQGTDVYQVRIEPLSVSEAQLKCGVDASWQRLGLPSYPVASPVRAGDTLAIDLLANSATGQKIVDYITVRRSGLDAVLSKPSHDFTAADAVLEFMKPRVSINGESAGSSSGGMSGTAVWIGIPGKGAFAFSLLPNEKLGFRRAGVVGRNGVTFQEAETTYRIDCSSRIAPGEGLYNLYVYHDPAWQGGQPGQLELRSAGRPEWLVRK